LKKPTYDQLQQQLRTQETLIASLKQIEEYYRNLLLNMTEEVHVWELIRDEHGAILTWRLQDINPAGLRAWGKSREETIGRLADEIFPGATAHFMPIVQKTFAEGKPHQWESHFLESNRQLKMTTFPVGEGFVTTGSGITRIMKSLQRREIRLGKAFSSDMMPMAIWKKTGYIVDANDALLALIGYTREEMEDGKVRWDELTPGEYHEQDQAALAQLNARGFCESYEKAYRHKDGHLVPILICGSQLDDHEGVGVLFAMDLTAHQRAQEVLRQSEFELAESQRVARLGSWSFDLATNAVRWSDELYRIFDVPRESFGGLYPCFLTRVHQDDQPQVTQTNARAIETGSSFEVDYRIVTRAGKTRFIHEVGYARKDAEGKVVGLFGTAQDITERRQAEEALRASEAKFRILADVAPALIWYNDTQGANIFVNQYFIDFSGMSAEEIRGAGWHTFVHPEERDAYVADYLAAVREQRTWCNQTRVHRKDGEWRWLDSHAQPLFGVHGAYLGHVGVSIDITAQKRINIEGADLLRRIESIMREVAAGQYAAHPQGAPDRDRLFQLSRRQREILLLIAQGKTSEAIAEHLHIAKATVITHRRDLMSRLNLHNTAEITRFAIEHSLLKS